MITLAVPVPAAGQAVIETLAFERTEDGGTVTMSVRGAHGEPRFLALNNPARLVLDLPGIRTENRKINGEGAIASMRVGQYKPDTARLALDLIKPMQISGSEHRDGKLLISLSETSAEAFAALTKLRPANLPRVQSGSSGIATTPAQTPSPPSSGSNPDGPAKHTASPVQLAYFQSPSERIVDTGAQDETAGAPRLPLPSGAPLSITAENDPLLNLSKQTESQEVFRAVIATAVARHPSIAEAEANVDRERAERREAQMGLVPDIELGIAGRQSITRNFGNDVDTVVERARARGRLDASFIVQQTILDFGATSARIEAAKHELTAAALETDAAAERTALSAVAAWYDVFAYRALVDLTEAFLANQQEFREAISGRIESGVNAEGDLARVESSLATTGASLAQYRRLAANAEARYTEMIGSPPPPGTQRAPAPDVPAITKDMAQFLARESPSVEAARQKADAGYDESRAVDANRLPSVSAGVEGGRYGVFDRDGSTDYDIRATINVRQRFFAGTFARADAQKAAAAALRARADAVAEEAAREAAIAWADVDALEAELEALENNYLASRRTRDVLAERFAVARGSLFDVLQAEDSYFAVAGRYVQALTERDAAHYVLLARTGRLLEALGIDTRGNLE
ncbi:TolC family protein [Pacificimonas sp. ICDLI1SI03]